MQQSFARVGVEGIEYYLLTKLVDGGKEGFELAISNGEQVWRAVVEASKIQSLAKAVDLDVSEFASQTARALTCQATSQDNFVYHAKRQGSSLQFAWKKHIGDGVKFQLGSLILSKVTDSAAVIKNIFDLAVDQMAELKEEMSSLRSDNARLSSERRDALKLLDKCVSAKEEIETDLFQKFAAVLNDKKSKIRQLKIQVNDAVSSTPAPAVKGNKSPECSKRVKKNSETLSRNESSGDDTDIEKMESGDESSKPRSLSPTGANERSKVHGKPSSAVFSPSLLLEDDNEEIQPVVKRRRRRDVKPKESPAPKLVLPKVPSVKKTPSNSSGESSTSSRPRLRQRASEKSSPDADDLMAEMEM